MKMANIFEYELYKNYVNERIKSMPHGGRGQFRLMAKKLNMHTTLISQIFNGDRHLNQEQACDLCQYWGLTSLETEFFFLLLQYNKASTINLQKILKDQLNSLRKRAEKLVNRLPQNKQLSETTQAIFYSNWFYSGIRLLSSIPGHRNVDTISDYFNLPKSLVGQTIEFLLANGLCVEKNGEIIIGPNRIHIPADSPFVTRHHQNWRVKGLEKIQKISEHELMFTAPMSLSTKDSVKVKKILLQMIDEISNLVKETNPEKVACLNIDWFDF